jgi:hypothetical protein
MFGKTKPGAERARVSDDAIHNPFLPTLALRRRSHEHPMVMFAALASICLGSMALAPAAGPALASAELATVKLAETVENTGKGPRLVPVTEAQIACHGQAWGNEDEECLVMIARESGRDPLRQVRMIASAEPDTRHPNIF